MKTLNDVPQELTKKLEKNVPQTYKGKKLKIKELFVSQASMPRKIEAQALVERIQKAHSNWTEFDSGVFKSKETGAWKAYRLHAIYM